AATRRTCRVSSCCSRGRAGPAAARSTGAAASCPRPFRACLSAPAASRSSTLAAPTASPPRSSAKCSMPSAARTPCARRQPADLNDLRLEETGDPEIATRIASYEMAYRMQSSAPELIDIKDESPKTLEMYGAVPGKVSFANNCLLARRLVERGVRFVQLYHTD